jgi:hypothetical protein
MIGPIETTEYQELKNTALLFKAGPAAYKDVRERGFAEERIGTIAGASGGAKWLVLSQLDRVIVDRLLPSLSGPVHLIGSSIGAWRFACYAQADPLAALDRFESLYLEQSYTEKPDSDEISRVGRDILRQILGEKGASEIVTNPKLRTHIMAVLSRNITSSDARPALAAGLFAAVAANLVSRRALGMFFSRALFFDSRDLPPFYNATGFPMERIRLSEQNLLDAVTASGSIPMVMNGVRDIDGAPAGTYRDGGILDYHLDLPTSDSDRLTLFPHFFDWLKPGWFDRQLAWRKHDPAHTDRTILICPSPEFIAGLPNGKVPDRTDFVNFSTEERKRLWRTAVSQCRAMADELNDVLDNGQLAARLQPM